VAAREIRSEVIRRRRGALSTVLALTLAGCSGSPSTVTPNSAVPNSTVPNSTVANSAVSGSDDATTTVVDPSRSTVTATGDRRPQGFTTVTARITEADGTVCEVCMWLADSPDERSRGLMDVTDLGEAAGMVFTFDEPIVGSFYMFDTPTPLSIAWFRDGSLIGTADMDPCLDTPAGECPLYSPGTAYDVALEVFEGGLDALGVGSGASLELVPGTEGPRCAAPPVTP
jgi:uncharacterized protein